MGNWHISIQGIGCHHNQNNPGDADKLAAKFVKQLELYDHNIQSASFTFGAYIDLLAEDIGLKSRPIKITEPVDE